MERRVVWEELQAHATRLKRAHLRDLLDGEPDRYRRFARDLDDLTIDFSREKLDAAALQALLRLADACGLNARIAALFAGEAVNRSEGRPALHMALRDGAEAPPGDDVAAARAEFLAFAESVRAGPWRDVLHIGVGGSGLGPEMAARALAPDMDGPALHYVANLDGADLADTVRRLDPARTLVIIASKSFSTVETLTNARLARDWLGAHGGENMVGVSARPEACAAFGLPPERIFRFWDWVGGRYSLWSAVGLSLAIGMGRRRFEELLAGARAMDRHFGGAPAAENLPVLLGLIGVWRRNFMGWPTAGLIPYDQRLARLPAWLQQLDMESGGKRTGADGAPVAHATAPVIWGEAGSNAQHSFFQWLHQGTDIAPVDFVLSARPRGGADADSHRLLLANALAQAEALARGGGGEAGAEVAGPGGAELPGQGGAGAELPGQGGAGEAGSVWGAGEAWPGDRPSTLILHRALTPFALGRLLALFEHRIFVESVIWDINPFDQWGVALGKQLAGKIATCLDAAGSGEGGEDAGPLAPLLTRLTALGEDK